MVNRDSGDDAQTITSIQVAMAEHAKRGLDIESLVTGVHIALEDRVAADWIIKALAPDDDARERLASTTKELSDRIHGIVGSSS